MKRLVLVAALLAACGHGQPGPAPSPANRASAAAPALDALRASRFADAILAADAVLGADDGNPQAAAARAIARTIEGWHAFIYTMMGSFERTFATGKLEHTLVRKAWEDLDAELAKVDADLARAAKDPGFALELCLACWERDWNRSGEIDERDRKLFEIEIDAKGEDLPEGDPRRRPTFRFDVGDLHWARAMVNFQRAAIALILAYRWDELDLVAMTKSGPPPRITIKLGDKGKIAAAKKLVLIALDEAAATRTAYLAETDDDREWVPNPKQQSHPMPLPVDAALYETWDGVVGDLRKLVDGKEGLAFRDLVLLGDDDPLAIAGYLNVGAIFSDPRDFDLDLDKMEHTFDRKPEPGPAFDAALAEVLGVLYAKDMPASPLPGRFLRMKKEMDRGEESFERKLRYLFWLN